MSQDRGSHSSDLSPALARLHSYAKTSRVQILQSALGIDADLHIVGGSVREIVRSESTDFENTDLDLATKLWPNEVAKRLESAKIHSILTGERHGTITAVVNSANVEITTFRRPGISALDQDKAFTQTISEDLAGRDFTINALAYSLADGKLLDPYHGHKDLKENILRAVGDAATRFREDPLRLMRMVRFGPASGRVIETATFAAAQRIVSSIHDVSVERVRDELVKILLCPSVSNAFRAVHQLGLLSEILPEFSSTVGFEQNEYHRFDLFEHTLAVIENCPVDKHLRLAALFHDLGKVPTLTIGDDGRRHFYRHEVNSAEMTEEIMTRFKFSNDEISKVSLLVRHHMRPLECGPPGIRRLIKDLNTELEDWVLFKRADSLGAKIQERDIDAAIVEFNAKVKLENERAKSAPFANLTIRGDDLIALGLKPGPIFGSILKELHEAVLDNPELNTKEQLLEMAKARIKPL